MHGNHRAISERAHRLWEARGRPTGEDEQIWLEAERLIRTEQSAAPQSARDPVDNSVRDSFPASDPPASNLPDKPASNVDEKWRAAGIKRTNAPASRTIKTAPKRPPSKRA
jgi:Protein of unknown function (DUF2934)